jgi:hypothetical protein
MWPSLSHGYGKNLCGSEEVVVMQFRAMDPLSRLCRIGDVAAFVHFLTMDGDYCTGQACSIAGGREMH